MTMYISPYRRLASFRDAMDRLVDETLAETASPERELVLAVDVQANDDDFTVRAMVPGLEADDLDIEIINNTVTIRGEFSDAPSEKSKFMTCELPQGRFSRVISLPVSVDAAKAEANLKNGILSLRIPKAEAHKPRSIKVSSVE
jgi:HSP20 family protein